MRIGWLVVLAGVLTGGEARSCSIPVFRYALEQWKPSPYEVTVFHRGPLDSETSKLVRQLQAPDARANMAVTVVDVAGPLPPKVKDLWSKHGRADQLPWLMVRFPEDDKSPPFWTGRLGEQAIRQLLDSPARRQIVKLLTKGESVVWILLEGDDKKSNDSVARMLNTELPRLQKALPLPETKEEDADLLSGVPLRISFPVLRLSRNQPEEQFFVQTLLGSEEGLSKISGPILFPIFGRGRVLLALHGEELTATLVERWTTFLCGACSCKVKEGNPGVDLLIHADWDELLETPEKEAPRTPTITAPAIPPGPPVAVEESEQEPRRCRCWLWSGVVGAGFVFLAGGVWLLRSRSAPKSG
jgi:hypothetical protein